MKAIITLLTVLQYAGPALPLHQPTAQYLDTVFKSFNKQHTPGYAVIILKDGKVLAKKSYGMASLEFKVPFNHNTVVTLQYSEGREFISIAAALLEADGKLTLNDNVQKYFPRLPAWSEAVTIQDLLNHSSGFADEWATLVLTQASMNNRVDVSQFLNFLYSQPLPQVEPGKGYMYSNSDFGLLRLILDQVTNGKLQAYMQQRMFVPLGMTATGLQGSKEDVVLNHANWYTLKEPGTYNAWYRSKTSPGGNYWVYTSANDIEKWAVAHNDKNSFISKALLRLQKNARPIPVLQGTNYVFGHKIVQVGKYEAIAHKGVSGYPHLQRVPAANLSVIVITNYHSAYDELVNKITAKLLGVKDERKIPVLPAKPVAISKESLKKYEGVYRRYGEQTFQSNVQPKRFTAFKLINDSLNWVYKSNDVFPVVPVGKGIFKDGDFPGWFVFQQSHPDSLMKLDMWGINESNVVHEYWVKDTAARKQYAKEALQRLTGIYYSPHLDFYWTFSLNEDGKLVLKRPTIADKIVEPGPDGDFELKTQYYEEGESSVWIRFYYDSTGSVTHLDANHSRLMHHRFDKVK